MQIGLDRFLLHQSSLFYYRYEDMNAISELVEPTLEQQLITRKVYNSPVIEGNQGDAANASVLYQHLELDALFDEFCARLLQLVSVDQVRLQHKESARSLTKSYASAGFENQFLLRYRLKYQGEILGTLSLKRRHQFLSAEVRQIQDYVDSLIGPLRNADRYLKVWRSAYQDALTGVKNRASFDLLLSGQEAGIEVHSLLVCDVDGFKSINDLYGHAVGDEVLRQFASQLCDSVGASGTVYRYGGDEFVIALHENRADDGLQLAEDLRLATARLRLKTRDHEISVTTTIGLARAHQNESLDETFLRADSALLFGKKRSKDTVIQH